MGYSEEFADRVRDLIFQRSGVVEKKMFGGIAWMIDGNMAVGVMSDDGLMVRLDRDEVEAVTGRPHVGPMEMTGRRMKGFVVIDSEGTEGDGDLAEWIDAGASYAESLPAK